MQLYAVAMITDKNKRYYTCQNYSICTRARVLVISIIIMLFSLIIVTTNLENAKAVCVDKAWSSLA